MRKYLLLSGMLVLLMLASCARSEAPQKAEHKGYLDAVEILPPKQETDVSAIESEHNAPTLEQAEKVQSKEEEKGEITKSVKEKDFTDDTLSNNKASDMEASAEPLQAENAALSAGPAAVPEILVAQASGTQVKQSERVVIDYSHPEDGYVMICFTGYTDKRLKAQVKGPTTTYTYNLTAGTWEVFSLSDGNGTYQVTVFENVVENKYAAEASVSFEVALRDEFAPYLLPNQYVNYRPGSKTVAKAAELVGSETDALKKVERVYDYVVGTVTYDVQKAASVQSGYLPVLDRVLEEKTGICFDYAALMTGMLRSQGIPCKLVVGYAGTTYHAWISVWSQETGWVDGAIFFDGTAWQRMDPTFASSGGKSESIMQFIGDGTNYTAKYIY